MEENNTNIQNQVARGIILAVGFIAFMALVAGYTSGVAEGSGISKWWSLIVDLPIMAFIWRVFLGQESNDQNPS